jgi:beta-lactamase regulating signal transducer with metallopeptidase domain
MIPGFANLAGILGDVETSLALKWPILLDTALKGAVLVALSAVMVACLRGRAAAIRHVVWTAAVAAHLALPALTVIVPALYRPMLPAPVWVGAPTRGTGSALLTLCAMIWLAGAAVGVLRIGVGWWRSATIANTAPRIRDREWLRLMAGLRHRLGTRRSVDLRCGSRYPVPVTIGILRPIILLPADAADWPAGRRTLVLAHELAHVGRFDTLTQLAAQIAVALFWYDPLVWIAARRMRIEREFACDDAVLRAGSIPLQYAHELVRIVQRLVARSTEAVPATLAGLAMARGHNEVHTRVAAILDSTRDRRPIRRLDIAWATLLVVLLTVPLAALRPFREPHPLTIPATHFLEQTRGHS